MQAPNNKARCEEPAVRSATRRRCLGRGSDLSKSENNDLALAKHISTNLDMTI